MTCVRCGKELCHDTCTWTVLDGGNMLVPACRDDRSCVELIPRGAQRVRRDKVVPKVRELAGRFAV